MSSNQNAVPWTPWMRAMQMEDASSSKKSDRHQKKKQKVKRKRESSAKPADEIPKESKKSKKQREHVVSKEEKQARAQADTSKNKKSEDKRPQQQQQQQQQRPQQNQQQREQVDPRLTSNGISLLKKGGQQQIVLRILNIRRFLWQEAYFQFVRHVLLALPPEDGSSTAAQIPQHAEDGFDIEFQDGRGEKVVALLSPSLNTMVDKRALYSGCIVKVNQYQKVMHELGNLGESFLLIKDLELVAEPEEDTEATVAAGQQGGVVVPKEVDPKPVVQCRGYYLPLYDEDNFYPTYSKPMPVLRELPTSFVSPSSFLSKELKSKRTNSRIGLVGRVIRKTKIFHYGKVSEKHELPMYFVLELGDAKSSITVTMWNRMCIEYFYSINVGDIIYIPQYRIKRSAVSSTTTSDTDSSGSSSGSDHSAQSFARQPIEISVNSTEPETVLHKIILPNDAHQHRDKEDTEEEEEEAAENQAGLVSTANLFPPLRFNLHASSQLPYLQDKALVDFVGVVISISRPYARERYHKAPHRFAQYTRLWMMDHSTKKIINCKVYTNSQIDALNRVERGNILLLTEMRLFSLWTNETCHMDSRQLLLESSVFTQIIPVVVVTAQREAEAVSNHESDDEDEAANPPPEIQLSIGSSLHKLSPGLPTIDVVSSGPIAAIDSYAWINKLVAWKDANAAFLASVMANDGHPESSFSFELKDLALFEELYPEVPQIPMSQIPEVAEELRYLEKRTVLMLARIAGISVEADWNTAVVHLESPNKTATMDAVFDLSRDGGDGLQEESKRSLFERTPSLLLSAKNFGALIDAEAVDCIKSKMMNGKVDEEAEEEEESSRTNKKKKKKKTTLPTADQMELIANHAKGKLLVLAVDLLRLSAHDVSVVVAQFFTIEDREQQQ